MAKINLPRDSRGNYKRDLGWEANGKGGFRQHRFYLGREHSSAAIRSLALERVWAAVEKGWLDNRNRGLPVGDRGTSAAGLHGCQSG